MSPSMTVWSDVASPTPFLKWAGGKSELIATLKDSFPSRFGTYFEPFLGGGSVFLHMVAKGGTRKAVISDSNKDLMNCYIAVREHVRDLIRRLEYLQSVSSNKTYYEQARKQFNNLQLNTGLDGNVEKAALMIYLNKTCYNGLYRVNKRGKFNVPKGRHNKITLYDRENLLAVHRVLRSSGVDIMCCDYREAIALARKGDFIYLDPPYVPTSRTANFTEYTKESFDWREQVALANTFRLLDARGCFIMLSNSPRVRRLYGGYGVKEVIASRAISCMPKERRKVRELVVTNY